MVDAIALRILIWKAIRPRLSRIQCSTGQLASCISVADSLNLSGVFFHALSDVLLEPFPPLEVSQQHVTVNIKHKS